MKTYIKPEVTLESIDQQNLMAGSPAIGYSGNDADNTKDVLGNSRRSNWGNLWGEEEEE